MSNKNPPKASKEDVVHHIMSRLRKQFPIDYRDENPDFISDPQIKKARQAKRKRMRNRASELLKNLVQHNVYPQPGATDEGRLIEEAIGHLVRGDCPCNNSNCPSRQPSVTVEKCDKCTDGGDCGGKCGGSHGGGGHSGNCDGKCGGKCGHKKP